MKTGRFKPYLHKTSRFSYHACSKCNLTSTVSHHLRVLLNLPDLGLELVNLSLVGRMWNCQVVHGEGPKRGVELRPEVVPDSGWVEGHHRLVHRLHHLLTGCYVLVIFLLLLVAFLRFLQLIVL